MMEVAFILCAIIGSLCLIIMLVELIATRDLSQRTCHYIATAIFLSGLIVTFSPAVENYVESHPQEVEFYGVNINYEDAHLLLTGDNSTVNCFETQPGKCKIIDHGTGNNVIIKPK